MSLKTSFFNSSIFKTDIKRFWWVCALETFIIFISNVFPEYQSFAKYHNQGISWSNGSFVFVMIFATGVSILLFSYLHSSAPVSTFHSMPIKRKGLFFTKLKGIFTLTITPLIINAVILLFMRIAGDNIEFFSMLEWGKWLFGALMYTLIAVSVAVITNMMTGNPIAALVFTAGFMAMPAIIISFSEHFLHNAVYGYCSDFANDILNYIYIDYGNLSDPKHFTVYIIISIILIICAYFLYKNRKLESYGEIISLTWLKPIFITIIAILASILSYSYFTTYLESDNLLCLIPFGILGTIIAQMVAKKSINPRGIHKPVAIYILSAILFIAAIQFDITGFERRIPKLEDIKSVNVVYANENPRYHYINGVEYRYTDVDIFDPTFKNTEDIENVIRLHKYLIENRERKTDKIIPISYTLKNGKTITREYEINLTKDAEFLKPVYETYEFKANRFPVIDGTKKNETTLKIRDNRFAEGTFMTLHSNTEEFSRLMEALKKDVLNVKYEDFASGSPTYTIINHEYSKDSTFEAIQKIDGTMPTTETASIEDVKEMSVPTSSDRYYIRDSYVNTISVLKELGYYDSLPKPEHFKSASVYLQNVTGGPVKEKEITDHTLIQELYNLYLQGEKHRNSEKESKNLTLSFTLTNGHKFEITNNYLTDEIPKIILEIID